MTATSCSVRNNFLGADQIAVVGEVGFNKQLPDNPLRRVTAPTPAAATDVLTGAGRNPITQVKGFPTDFSWGYRIAARAPTTTTPSARRSPCRRALPSTTTCTASRRAPAAASSRDASRSRSVREATYLNNLGLDLSYTSFFGAGNLNLIGDRDFVSVAVKFVLSAGGIQMTMLKQTALAGLIARADGVHGGAGGRRPRPKWPSSAPTAPR